MRALNYILVLENLQVAFFDTGLGNLTAEDFVLAGYNESVYNQLKLMQQQHIVRAPFPPASQSPRGSMRWLTTRSHCVCQRLAPRADPQQLAARGDPGAQRHCGGALRV